MKSNHEIWNSDFIKKHIKSFQSVLVIGYDNTDLKKILSLNKNALEEVHLDDNQNISKNLGSIKSEINSTKKNSEFCILNFFLAKNSQQIVNDIFNISHYVLVPINRKKYGYFAFKRFCTKNNIKIKNAQFYKNNGQLSGFFAKYFFDKAFLIISKDINAPVYQEEFIKDKLLNLLAIKNKRRMASGVNNNTFKKCK